MTNRWQAIFLLFVFAFVLPGTAQAQNAPPSSQDQAYRDLLARARQAADKDNFTEAIRLWTQAWNIRPHWHLFCYIGQGHFWLNQPDKAATFLTRCLKLAPYPNTRDGIDHRRKEREMLDIALDHVAVVVVTAPQGARVSVNAEELGAAPLSEDVFLLPGDHRFIAERNSRIASRTLNTQRREKYTVDLVFAQEKAEPPPPKPLETKPIGPKPIEIPRSIPVALHSAPSFGVGRWVPSIALLGTSAGLATAGFLMKVSAEEHKRTAIDIRLARKAAANAGDHEECSALTLPYQQERADYHRMFYGSLFSFGAAAVLGTAGLVYPWLPFHGNGASVALSPSSISVQGNF